MPPRSAKEISRDRIPPSTGDWRRERDSWPVYKMQYPKYGGGGFKELRLEWNHAPESVSCTQTIAAIRAYINNTKRDDNDWSHNKSFKDVQPEFGIVLAGPHSTTTETRSAKSTRPADTETHVSVHFSSRSQRARGEGISVHIYVDPVTKKYIPKTVNWPSLESDTPSQERVYKNRDKWPAGASATEAPWAPGEEPMRSTAQSTAHLKPAEQPATRAWGGGPPPGMSGQQSTSASSLQGTSIDPQASFPEDPCPPSCEGVKWTPGGDSRGLHLQGVRRDGTIVYKRDGRYTDERGNKITN